MGGTHRQTAYTKKHEIALGLGHWIILKCYELISLTHNSTVFASHTLFLEVFQTISSGVKEWPVGSTVVGIWAQARFSVAVSDSADLWQCPTAAQLACQAEVPLWSEAGCVYPATAWHTMQICPKHPEMQTSMPRDFECAQTPTCWWRELSWKALWKMAQQCIKQVWVSKILAIFGVFGVYQKSCLACPSENG